VLVLLWSWALPLVGATDYYLVIFLLPRVKFVHVFAPASFPIATISHDLAMDSIPQELIDAIIDNVPQSSIPSCSLVSKRWRRPSQRRVLSTVSFSSENEMNRWCTDIPRDSDGISSYVRRVEIQRISSWNEPVLLNRTLGTLSSLKTLSIYATEIPDELPGYISRGAFGKGITALYLQSTYCTLATMTSMILSLPNLKELDVECGIAPEGPPLTDSVIPQRGPLNALELHGYMGGIGEALAKYRFISSRLALDTDIKGVEQLLTLSSETVVELKLRGAWLLWILRPSRDDSDRSSRSSTQRNPPSYPSTIITRPYHSGYPNFRAWAFASPYEHPALHWLSSSVEICRYSIQRLGLHPMLPFGGSVG
jgi:hypothetical protein